ncbi:Nucleic-acid-binding protein from transposon X-element, partial [Stegodyphus mimosarum]
MENGTETIAYPDANNPKLTENENPQNNPCYLNQHLINLLSNKITLSADSETTRNVVQDIQDTIKQTTPNESPEMIKEINYLLAKSINQLRIQENEVANKRINDLIATNQKLSTQMEEIQTYCNTLQSGGPFKEQRKRRHRSNTSSDSETDSDEITPTTNSKFAHLDDEGANMIIENPEEEETKKEQIKKPTASKINKKPNANSKKTNKEQENNTTDQRIPPIIIDDVPKPNEFIENLRKQTEKDITGQIKGNKLHIFTPDPDSHRYVRKVITETDLKAHTYQLPDEKVLKIVIRGLSITTNPIQITQDLKDKGFDVKFITLLRNRKENKPMPLFLIHLAKTEENKAIHQLKRIGYLNVQIESLKRKSGPPQCFKCQSYFHSSVLCTRDWVCVRCGDNHQPSNC